MYAVDDKNFLYWLMEQYLSGSISATKFCDLYYKSYDLEVDSSSFTPMEDQVFSELGVVAGRFTDIQEDLKKYHGTYFNEKQLRRRVIETKKKLGVVLSLLFFHFFCKVF